jgi:tetratricopeptide (TPR) repeat protein
MESMMQGKRKKEKGKRWTRWLVFLFPFSFFFFLFSSVSGQESSKKDTKGASQLGGGKGDIALVEQLLAARRQYQRALERLRLYYVRMRNVEKAHWAEEELKQYHRIAKQAYCLDLDVPPPTLRPAQNIPEANKIFHRAKFYMNRGWGTDYVDNQRRAELLFQQILSQYPQCDKIGAVAYELGEIYESKAYKQYRRAAMYYERCFEWNPHTTTDARLRAARLYDKYTLDRGKAIELYKDVTQHDTDANRIAEAEKRLSELSGSR